MAPDPEKVRRELQQAIAFVRSRIYTLENEFARRLLAQYQTAFDELSAQLDQQWQQSVSGAEWNATDANWQRRTRELTDQVSQKMEALNVQIHDELVAEQTRAWRASYYGNGWIVDHFSPADFDVNLPLIPDEAVRAQLLFPYEDNTAFFRLEANRLDFINKLRASLIQSQVQGDTIYNAQKRLADALGLPIGRRTASDKAANSGNFARTEMIARTELLRGSNLGAMAIYDANKDVVKQWEFIATLDMRTCEICGPLDGAHYDIGDTTELPPQHPLCRCTSAPITVSFEEMGLSGVPEMGPGTRASMFGPVSGKMTYSDWALGQGVNRNMDGGLAEIPPGKPPKSPAASPVRSKPLVGKGLSVR